MGIGKEEYNKLKPYWDFQRKKEYNKEQLMYVCQHIVGVEENSFFDEMWARLDEEHYLEPPEQKKKKNEKLRLD